MCTADQTGGVFQAIDNAEALTMSIAMSHAVDMIGHMFVEPDRSCPATLDAVTAHASDVAARLRGMLPGADDVKVHKLLYYVQGHHLAWHGRPAFRETIEAWINGPVVAELWRAEKYDSPPEAGPVDPDVLEIVYMVVSRYGHLTGKDLIKLTHSEDPWRDLAESDDEMTSSGTPIAHGALAAFFSDDDELSSIVRDRVAEVAADTPWIPTAPDELDDLEATYSSP